MIFIFWMLSFKPTFSLSSFTFIERLFNSSSLSAIRVVSSAYLRLLIFLLAILWAACILKLRAVFLCCWRICVVYIALELVGPWVVLDFSVGWRRLMSSCRLMFPGVRSSLVFSGFGLKPTASGFQSYSYIRLKTSPSILYFQIVPWSGLYFSRSIGPFLCSHC